MIRTRPGIPASQMALVPHGSAVWLVEDGRLSRLDVATGQHTTMIPDVPANFTARAVTISQDGGTLAVLAGYLSDPGALVWDTRTGLRIAELASPAYEAGSRIAFGADARSLVLMMTDPEGLDLNYRLEVWDITTGSHRVLFTDVQAVVTPP
ncbi:MAG: hypothetical protein ACRDTG_19660 [Pseudonocardiaceae bacterium]